MRPAEDAAIKRELLMPVPTSSVQLISYRRPDVLTICLERLAAQALAPSEIIVVWQADDVDTRDAAERFRDKLPCPLLVVHSPEAGVVAAENAGLDAGSGEILLLLDDDSVVPPDWVRRHLAHYSDPIVGAVGGSADNFCDGAFLPKRSAEPIGTITWFGRALGRMHDQLPEWRSRPPIEVMHIVGYNMSIRRDAFDRFEPGLRAYWQMFEMDACLQARSRGYRVLFDYANVIEHHPRSAVFDGSREGDLAVKIYNGAYNHAFILAKHRPWRIWQLAYLLMVGSVAAPGLVAFPVAMKRFGNVRRESGILGRTMRSHLAGWRDGLAARSSHVLTPKFCE